MPTKESLNQSWESDFEFGLNNLEAKPVKFSEEDSGEVIGKIELDPINKDLKIVPTIPTI